MGNFVETAAALVRKQSICVSETDSEAALDRVLAPTDRLRTVSFVNAHAVMRATRDPEFRDVLLNSDELFRDGAGMSMLMERAGCEPGINMNGTDLIPKLIERTPRKTKVALLGTCEPRLSQTADYLRKLGFSSIVTADGFRPEEDYEKLLMVEKPTFVILAMGMPKQERVTRLVSENPVLSSRDMVVINGGAIIDVLSGEVLRAPSWMQRAGLEWLYRLIRDPVRLFPRFCDSIMFATQIYFQGAAFRRALTQDRK